MSKKWFQEWLLDPMLGGFWAQVGAKKSPKKGSKTQKNHVQDNIETNNIFNEKRLHQESCGRRRLADFRWFRGPNSQLPITDCQLPIANCKTAIA